MVCGNTTCSLQVIYVVTQDGDLRLAYGLDLCFVHRLRKVIGLGWEHDMIDGERRSRRTTLAETTDVRPKHGRRPHQEVQSCPDVRIPRLLIDCTRIIKVRLGAN